MVYLGNAAARREGPRRRGLKSLKAGLWGVIALLPAAYPTGSQTSPLGPLVAAYVGCTQRVFAEHQRLGSPPNIAAELALGSCSTEEAAVRVWLSLNNVDPPILDMHMIEMRMRAKKRLLP